MGSVCTATNPAHATSPRIEIYRFTIASFAPGESIFLIRVEPARQHRIRPDCTIDNSARAKIANVNRDIEKSAGEVGVPEIGAQQIGRLDVRIDKHRISEIGAMHLRLN